MSERFKLGGMASVEEGPPPFSIIDTQPGAKNPVEWVAGRDAAEKRVAELNAAANGAVTKP